MVRTRGRRHVKNNQSPFPVSRDVLAPANTGARKVWRPPLVLYYHTMPPDSRSPNQTLDISMLDVEASKFPAGLETTLRSIESLCLQANPAIAGMVSTLNSRSHILECIFSGVWCLPAGCNRPLLDTSFSSSVLDEKAYEKLSAWIISEFPTPTTSNMTDTLSMRLLQRFSASLLFAEYPSASDAPPDLYEFWKKVELSIQTLQNLEKNPKDSLFRRKRGKTVTRDGRADSFRPDNGGINVPTTDTEVHEVRARVLLELRNILEVCGSRLISAT